MYELIITTLTFVNGSPLPAETFIKPAGEDLKQCIVSATNIKDRMEYIEGDKVVVVRVKARCMATKPNKKKIKIYEERQQ